jgi:hypothetical protein
LVLVSSVIRQPGNLPSRSDLARLTDSEIAELALSVSEYVTDGGVRVDGVREVLNDWAVIARLRNHPDFDADRSAFRRVLGEA